MSNKINAKFISDTEMNDELYYESLIAELESLIEVELSKPEAEIRETLIDECCVAIEYLHSVQVGEALSSYETIIDIESMIKSYHRRAKTIYIISTVCAAVVVFCTVFSLVFADANEQSNLRLYESPGDFYEKTEAYKTTEEDTTAESEVDTTEVTVTTEKQTENVTVDSGDTQAPTKNDRVDGEPTLNSEGYYELYSYNDLKWFADYVNSGNYSANAVVKDIIKFPEEVLWTPMGSEANPYTGNFKGGNYDMLGMFLENEGVSVLGLFGCIGKGGKVEKVILYDSFVRGNEYIGGICGKNYGTIYDCCTGGRISGAKYIGGVAGYNAGDIIDCYNGAHVGGDQAVGGMAGIHDSGKIDDCVVGDGVYADQDAGGIAGICKATIVNSRTDGNVNGKKNTGGIVGVAEATAVIKNCKRNFQCDGYEVYGDIVGLNKTANIEDCIHQSYHGYAVGYCEYHGTNSCLQCDIKRKY